MVLGDAALSVREAEFLGYFYSQSFSLLTHKSHQSIHLDLLDVREYNQKKNITPIHSRTNARTAAHTHTGSSSRAENDNNFIWKNRAVHHALCTINYCENFNRCQKHSFYRFVWPWPNAREPRRLGFEGIFRIYQLNLCIAKWLSSCNAIFRWKFNISLNWMRSGEYLSGPSICYISYRQWKKNRQKKIVKKIQIKYW